MELVRKVDPIRSKTATRTNRIKNIYIHIWNMIYEISDICL